MFKHVAPIAILFIAFTSTVTGQATKNIGPSVYAGARREESLGGAEAAKAIARLGDLSRVTIRERLKQMRLPAYLPGPALVNKIIEAQNLAVASGKRVEKLKAALQPVLDYHGRSQMPIYVLWS